MASSSCRCRCSWSVVVWIALVTFFCRYDVTNTSPALPLTSSLLAATRSSLLLSWPPSSRFANGNGDDGEHFVKQDCSERRHHRHAHRATKRTSRELARRRGRRTRHRRRRMLNSDIITRVAPDIIFGPGRNPAKFSYPAISGYEVGFDHLSMHLPHCVIGQEFIVLQIR